MIVPIKVLLQNCVAYSSSIPITLKELKGSAVFILLDFLNISFILTDLNSYFLPPANLEKIMQYWIRQ